MGRGNQGRSPVFIHGRARFSGLRDLFSRNSSIPQFRCQNTIGTFNEMLIYLYIIKKQPKSAFSDKEPANVVQNNMQPRQESLLFPIVDVGASADGL
jgi:hypothetical protein